jgi:hypothetical protein
MFMVRHPATSISARIELRYPGTTEQRVMAGISVLAWMAAFAALIGFRAKSRGVLKPKHFPRLLKDSKRTGLSYVWYTDVNLVF